MCVGTVYVCMYVCVMCVCRYYVCVYLCVCVCVMCVCTYVLYICMYVCMHLYVCMHACINVCMYVLYICMHVCMCVRMYLCVCTYVGIIYICMHVCIVCVYVRMYVFVCMYVCRYYICMYVCVCMYVCMYVRTYSRTLFYCHRTDQLHCRHQPLSLQASRTVKVTVGYYKTKHKPVVMSVTVGAVICCKLKVQLKFCNNKSHSSAIAISIQAYAKQYSNPNL